MSLPALSSRSPAPLLFLAAVATVAATAAPRLRLAAKMWSFFLSATHARRFNVVLFESLISDFVISFHLELWTLNWAIECPTRYRVNVNSSSRVVWIFACHHHRRRRRRRWRRRRAVVVWTVAGDELETDHFVRRPDDIQAEHCRQGIAGPRTLALQHSGKFICHVSQSIWYLVQIMFGIQFPLSVYFLVISLLLKYFDIRWSHFDAFSQRWKHLFGPSGGGRGKVRRRFGRQGFGGCRLYFFTSIQWKQDEMLLLMLLRRCFIPSSMLRCRSNTTTTTTTTAFFFWSLHHRL